MKKHLIIISMLLVCGMVAAQQRHTFLIQKEYDKIIVEQGCPVTLIQSGTPNDKAILRMDECVDTLDRIVVYADGEVKSSQVFRIHDGLLRICPSKSMPQGARVEVYTAQQVRRIELHANAVLATSRFEGYGELTFAQWQGSRLEADTLASVSLLFGFKGDSSYFHCNVIEAAMVLFDEDNGHYEGTRRHSCTDTPTQEEYVGRPYTGTADRLVPLWDEAPCVKFHEDFSLHFGLGARLLADALNETGDYLSWDTRYNISVSIYGKWKLSHRWDARVGVQYDWFRTPLTKPFDDPNSIVPPDHDNVISSRIDQHFIGIPASITFHPIRRNPEALGLNVGVLLSRQLSGARYTEEEPDRWGGTIDFGYMVPWRAELRLGIETNVLGIFHGLQFYYNLLPTVRGLPDSQPTREFGVAISF